MLVAVDVAIIGVDVKNLVGASLVTNSILSVGFFLQRISVKKCAFHKQVASVVIDCVWEHACLTRGKVLGP